MKLPGLKNFNNLLKPIKNLILICVMEMRLVYAEYSKKYVGFFKGLYFYTKKYRSNLQRNINFKSNIFLSDH